ncbi:hypothetical protein T4B_5570 [Trichinella pseudospiralis]|uniref:Uncharacterized protein n=1 Tax=Trichinella pseudospiralis TaxID=6337 RepID=A0A0V1DWK7_TRIPS|nr:hypothetical protein T4A_13129 [Trichinella pseudospiralis]KRZ18226.1 hypothetical protein T4B_5570 [Trichinella pseudospiralis]KRZ35181.1 hypothetical protein T4C_8392 [Trichinella pseudospiralis]
MIQLSAITTNNGLFKFDVKQSFRHSRNMEAATNNAQLRDYENETMLLDQLAHSITKYQPFYNYLSLFQLIDMN